MPLTSPSIQEHTVESASKALWNEWLRVYFDGGTHNIGNAAGVGFPKANISFDQHPPKQPLDTDTPGEERVEITVTSVPGRESRKNQDGGRFASSSVTFNFWIQAKGRDAGDSRALAQLTADRLKAILSNPDCTIDLARKGIRDFNARKPAKFISSDWDMYLVTCSARLQFDILFS